MDLQDGVSRRLWKPGAGRALLDVFLPPTAYDGGASLSPGLTADAWSRIVFLEGPVCDGCGSPFEYDAGEDRCAACTAHPRRYDRARAACLYDEHSRDLILQLKHGDRTDLSGLFARWLSRAARDVIEDAEVVVPVPLHRWRLLRRRYNQAAEIARPLARLAGLTYLPDALRRVRPTASQGGRSGSGRRRNVAGAFAASAQVADKRVLLVDDVLTTGATAEACARALKLAGATSVSLAVVSKVKDAAPQSI